MVYLMSITKALTLAYALHVGEPALCPDQGRGDDEQECEITAIVNSAHVVVMVRK